MGRSNGYIRLHRSILTWEWYGDANTMRLFVHMILKASYKDDDVLKRGQLLTTYKELSKELNLTEKQIRVAMNHLKDGGEVTCDRYGNGQMIFVKNYGKFQISFGQTKGQTKGQTYNGFKNGENTAFFNSSIDSVGRPKGTQKGNHINKYINNNPPTPKGVSPQKQVYGEFKNVLLTAEEHIELGKKMGDGKRDFYIAKLDRYIEKSGKKYERHYAVLIDWFEEDKKELGKRTSYDISEIESIC